MFGFFVVVLSEFMGLFFGVGVFLYVVKFSYALRRFFFFGVVF